MSYVSKRSESSASRRSLDMDALDDGGDDRDESKRKSRNLSEKKRRDQFNILVNELCSMVSNSPRKMDKSTVLKATIAFLKAHNELAVQSQVQETQEDWKPSFLSNEEFTHLMMESLDGFIIVISSTGQILYLSESVTSLLGHLSSDLVNRTIYDYMASEDRLKLHNVLSTPSDEKGRNSISTVLNFRVGGLGITQENLKYQLVRIVGYFKRWILADCGGAGSETNTEKSEGEFSESNDSSGNNYIFIATGRLIEADLLREMSVVVDTAKNEFSSRHSLEWKFLFLDHRAPPIIGYLPFEVLGTSGYDYYHAEDLEKVANCHEALMQKGEGTSCFYRFLTKGQQWIWLQTRFYITYHQWNSKPEFIVCTHRVVSYADVMKDLRGEITLSHSPRLGPSPPKQPKLEPKRTSGSLKLSKQKNPQKSAMTPETFPDHSSPSSGVIQPPNLSEVPVALAAVHPSSQISQFVQPHNIQASSEGAPVQQLPAPIPTFHSSTASSQSQNFPGISNSSTAGFPGSAPPPPSASVVLNSTSGNSLVGSSQCVMQEQLLMKHAELQRQIIQQQEELRQVSEQLLMSQCGFVPTDNNPILIQQTIQTSSAEETNSAANLQVQ